MEPYSGVVTTGIYCRPGCPARPDPGNVVGFPDPAAAEAAGFRACLRCRPYRSPTPANGDAPDLVCRAVRLIVAGALDGAGENALAARLGVSARHLRRLVVSHVGATPDQVARSRRAHFARRLLDDTDLTVTEVAFASGYGSVRQLNRACKDVFRATPVELRARRRRADRLAADGGLTLRLRFCGTVDWPAFLAYFAVRAIPGVESVDAVAYRRTIVVDGDPGVLEVTAGGADHLLMRAHLPHWEGLIHVVERVRRIFGLDTDIDAAAATLRGDPLIGPLVDARPGLRVPGAWDPFEVGVRAILGQQVTVSGASTLAARLVERHGTPVPGLGQVGLRYTFPTPDSLAAADLDGLGIVGTRIAAIRAFARGGGGRGGASGRQPRPRRSRGVDHRAARPGPMDGRLPRLAARRAGCLPGHRPGADPVGRRTGRSAGTDRPVARRTGRGMATVAGPGRRPPVDGRRARTRPSAGARPVAGGSPAGRAARRATARRAARRFADDRGRRPPVRSRLPARRPVCSRSPARRPVRSRLPIRRSVCSRSPARRPVRSRLPIRGPVGSRLPTRPARRRPSGPHPAGTAVPA